MALTQRAHETRSRLVKVRAGARGSGWAVGDRGVLTARHVVAPFLTGAATYCLAVPDPRPQAAAFECSVVWQDERRDLALLAVSRSQADDWTSVVGPGPGSGLAEPGLSALMAEAVGFPDVAVVDERPHRERVLGWLKPAAGPDDGVMAFDVDGGVPESSQLWAGMSGAAVMDRPYGRLLGLVVRVDRQRQQRRFSVSPLPDPATDPAFAHALGDIGAPAVLECREAPEVRRSLRLWDERGRPRRVADVRDAGDFGARRARTDVDLHGDPYYPYVRRPFDEEFEAALDRRAAGTEKRMLLLVGSAMSGKSRSGARALQAHAEFSSRRLLSPQVGADLRLIADFAVGGSVLWLDDLNTHVRGLDAGLVRLWASIPGLAVIGTLRREILAALAADHDHRPALDVIMNAELVERIDVPDEWDPDTIPEEDGMLRERVVRGAPLGEVLGAADELRNRLEGGDSDHQAYVHAIVDWSRAGVVEPLPEHLAGELFVSCLTSGRAEAFHQLVDEDQHDLLREIRGWATTRIPGTSTALLARRRDGLIAEDYLVSQRTRNRQAIPAAVWAAALAFAGWDNEVALSNIGLAAANDAVYDVAQEAWERLARRDSDVAPPALRNLGLLFHRRDFPERSRAAYERAIATRDRDVAPQAAVGLGSLLRDMGEVEEAKQAYRFAISMGHPEHSPAALRNLGSLLSQEGDLDGAMAAYRTSVESDHPEHAPWAALALGSLLATSGASGEARDILQYAIDSGHHDCAPAAQRGVAMMDHQVGDIRGAQTLFEAVASSGHRDQAPQAQIQLAELLRDRGDVSAARRAYDAAVHGGHPEHAPRASLAAGKLAFDEGDVAAARAAFETAAKSQHPEHAPLAHINLGALDERDGNLPAAAAEYRQAVASGHAEHAPAATMSLARVLASESDTEGAKEAYQSLIDGGLSDLAATAALDLGVLLEGEHDVPAARAIYRVGIESEHEEYAPQCAINLANSYAADGEISKALECYQVAIGSGHVEWRQLALLNKAVVLATSGDPDGARAAFQVAIDSGHDEHAPAAAINLGMMLQEAGELADAELVYRTVIDGAHVGHAETARLCLGELLWQAGNLAGARTAFEGVTGAGNPGNLAAAQVSLGGVLLRLHDQDSARSALEAVVARDTLPDSAWANLLLGEYCSREDPHQRLRHRELAIGSEDSMVLLSYAELEAREGHVDEALALLRRSVTAGHELSASYSALLAPEAEDREAALVLVTEAADKGDTDSLNILGLVALTEGRFEAAHALWEQSAAARDYVAPLLLKR